MHLRHLKLSTWSVRLSFVLRLRMLQSFKGRNRTSMRRRWISWLLRNSLRRQGNLMMVFVGFMFLECIVILGHLRMWPQIKGRFKGSKTSIRTCLLPKCLIKRFLPSWDSMSHRRNRLTPRSSIRCTISVRNKEREGSKGCWI